MTTPLASPTKLSAKLTPAPIMVDNTFDPPVLDRTVSGAETWQGAIRRIADALNTRTVPSADERDPDHIFRNLMDLTAEHQVSLTISDRCSTPRGDTSHHDSAITNLSKEELINLSYTLSYRISSRFNHTVADIAMHVLSLLPRRALLDDSSLIGFTIHHDGRSCRFPLHYKGNLNQCIDLHIL